MSIIYHGFSIIDDSLRGGKNSIHKKISFFSPFFHVVASSVKVKK